MGPFRIQRVTYDATTLTITCSKWVRFRFAVADTRFAAEAIRIANKETLI